MPAFLSQIEKEVVPILLEGGVGVFPTDTLYGLVGSALNKQTVERLYAIRKRELNKPFIILISSLEDLALFGIELTLPQQKALKRFWPGKISFVLPCSNKQFSYLHRDHQNLALRLPKDKPLLKLLKKTGPLVAPSANPAGLTPAATYEEAKKYFGDKVDFYVDYGKLVSSPSTLAKLDAQGNMEILREGAVKVK